VADVPSALSLTSPHPKKLKEIPTFSLSGSVTQVIKSVSRYETAIYNIGLVENVDSTYYGSPGTNWVASAQVACAFSETCLNVHHSFSTSPQGEVLCLQQDLAVVTLVPTEC
jgi:hypothetical protein